MKKIESSSTVALIFLFVLIASGGQAACRSDVPQPSRVSASPSTTPDPKILVDQIFDKYIEALGGQAHLDQVTSYAANGTFEMTNVAEKGTFEIFGKDPNKSLVVIEFPRAGTFKKGFDGETRWIQNPRASTSNETPEDLANVERDAEIYRAGKLRQLFQSTKLEGKARLNGRDVYIIEAKPSKGPAEKMFFDLQSGLLLRWDMVRNTADGSNLFVKVHLDDYREVDGVKLPFTIRYSFESFGITLRIDDLKHNVPLDDALFIEPALLQR